MSLMRGTEKKRTAAFHLTQYVIERIETLARVRRSNKSHEVDTLLRQALALPENQRDLTAGESERVA